MMKKQMLLIVMMFMMGIPMIHAQSQSAMLNSSVRTTNLSFMNNYAQAIGYINGVKTIFYSPDDPLEIVGTPFMDPEFKDGAIYFSDSTIVSDIQIRYNSYHDEMQIKYGNDTAALHPSYKVIGVSIEDRFFIYSLIYEEGTKVFTDGYFELLADGEVRFLKQHRKELKYDSYVTNYNGGGGDKKYHFFDQKTLFYKSGRESAQKIRAGKKRIVKLFPDHHDELFAYIEKEDLALRKEEDLARLFNYYNKIRYGSD